MVKLHDEKSEGLSRQLIIKMVIAAGGGDISRAQATCLWDQTILPLGKRLGLITGYVAPQEGTSKRTAAGSPALQRKWYDVVTELFSDVKKRACEVLNDDNLVEQMMPWLVVNLDEECLHAMGKSYKIVGSADRTKHDNQNASSRWPFF